jgi:hypothetical protein
MPSFLPFMSSFLSFLPSTRVRPLAVVLFSVVPTFVERERKEQKKKGGRGRKDGRTEGREGGEKEGKTDGWKKSKRANGKEGGGKEGSLFLKELTLFPPPFFLL